MGEINITIAIRTFSRYISQYLITCEIMGYVVQFLNHNDLAGYLKCGVKKTKQLHLIFPKNILQQIF